MLNGLLTSYVQVRCMAAVLLMVGRGEEDPSIVKRLLEVNLEPRKPMYSMAPDEPLFLFKCAYEEDALTWHRNRTNLDNVLETLRAAENR